MKATIYEINIESNIYKENNLFTIIMIRKINYVFHQSVFY